MNNIGKHISQRRKELGLTQEMLAERLHVTRQSVSNYETARSQPDIEMLKSLAEALDTDIETLLYGTSKPPVTADPALAQLRGLRRLQRLRYSPRPSLRALRAAGSGRPPE